MLNTYLNNDGIEEGEIFNSENNTQISELNSPENLNQDTINNSNNNTIATSNKLSLLSSKETFADNNNITSSNTSNHSIMNDDDNDTMNDLLTEEESQSDSDESESDSMDDMSDTNEGNMNSNNHSSLYKYNNELLTEMKSAEFSIENIQPPLSPFNDSVLSYLQVPTSIYPFIEEKQQWIDYIQSLNTSELRYIEDNQLNTIFTLLITPQNHNSTIYNLLFMDKVNTVYIYDTFEYTSVSFSPSFEYFSSMDTQETRQCKPVPVQELKHKLLSIFKSCLNHTYYTLLTYNTPTEILNDLGLYSIDIIIRDLYKFPLLKVYDNPVQYITSFMDNSTFVSITDNNIQDMIIKYTLSCGFIIDIQRETSQINDTLCAYTCTAQLYDKNKSLLQSFYALASSESYCDYLIYLYIYLYFYKTHIPLIYSTEDPSFSPLNYIHYIYNGQSLSLFSVAASIIHIYLYISPFITHILKHIHILQPSISSVHLTSFSNNTIDVEDIQVSPITYSSIYKTQPSSLLYSFSNTSLYEESPGTPRLSLYTSSHSSLFTPIPDLPPLYLIFDIDLTLIHAGHNVQYSDYILALQSQLDSQQFSVIEKDLFQFPLSKYCQDPTTKKDMYQNIYIWGKFRPGIHDLLDSLYQRYQLIIYTHGEDAYAKQILSKLDPSGLYFKNRIISREFASQVKNRSIKSFTDIIYCINTDWNKGDYTVLDDKDPIILHEDDIMNSNTHKESIEIDQDKHMNVQSTLSMTESNLEDTKEEENPLELNEKNSSFPIQSLSDILRHSLIIDDRKDIWINEKRTNLSTTNTMSVSLPYETEEVLYNPQENVYKCSPYIFFSENTLTPEQVIQYELIERDYVMAMKNELISIYDQYSSQYMEYIQSKQNKKQTIDIEMNNHKNTTEDVSSDIHQNTTLSPPDIRQIYSRDKSNVLHNETLCFTGLIPTNIKPQSHWLYELAQEFGARCSLEVIEGQTTHIIASNKITDKVKLGQQYSIPIVRKEWLLLSCQKFMKESDQYYLLYPEYILDGTQEISPSNGITDNETQLLDSNNKYSNESIEKGTKLNNRHNKKNKHSRSILEKPEDCIQKVYDQVNQLDSDMMNKTRETKHRQKRDKNQSNKRVDPHKQTYKSQEHYHVQSEYISPKSLPIISQKNTYIPPSSRNPQMPFPPRNQYIPPSSRNPQMSFPPPRNQHIPPSSRNIQNSFPPPRNIQNSFPPSRNQYIPPSPRNQVSAPRNQFIPLPPRNVQMSPRTNYIPSRNPQISPNEFNSSYNQYPHYPRNQPISSHNEFISTHNQQILPSYEKSTIPIMIEPNYSHVESNQRDNSISKTPRSTLSHDRIQEGNIYPYNKNQIETNRPYYNSMNTQNPMNSNSYYVSQDNYNQNHDTRYNYSQNRYTTPPSIQSRPMNTYNNPSMNPNNPSIGASYNSNNQSQRIPQYPKGNNPYYNNRNNPRPNYPRQQYPNNTSMNDYSLQRPRY